MLFALAATAVPKISPNSDFPGAGLVRSAAGAVIVFGLLLAAGGLLAAWWGNRSGLAGPLVGVGAACLGGGVFTGVLSGGPDLGPLWALVRLGGFAAALVVLGAGVVVGGRRFARGLR